MTTLRRLTLVGLALLLPRFALAVPGADRPAAVLNFPYLVVDAARGIDTVVQITNSSSDPTDVACVYYVDTDHCSNGGAACRSASDCPPGGACVDDFQEVDFDLHLTPRQPIGWRIGVGLYSLPVGSGAAPPVPDDPFLGSLQCIVVDALRRPIDRNALHGTATVERHLATAPPVLDSARYSGIGLEAIPGANDGDDVLRFGGEDAEYAACPLVTILSHFFENAVDPVDPSRRLTTRLALRPCSAAPLLLDPGRARACVSTFNEFEQRLDVERSFDGLLAGRLSELEPALFDVAVQGTLAGQTRIANLNQNGLLAVALEEKHDAADPARFSTSAVEAHFQGDASLDVLGASPTCGNARVEAQEGCDDGNTAAGDGCDAACAVELCFHCTGEPSLCGPPDPYACLEAPTSSLLVTDNALNDERDRLVFRWLDGDTTYYGPTQPSDFGNPLAVTDYTLCIFDGPRLAVRATVEHGGTCNGRDCWKEARGGNGFVYSNPAENADGIFESSLRVGRNGKADVIVRARGPNLALPGPAATGYFEQNPSVDAYLFHNCHQYPLECLHSRFTDSSRNTTTSFRAATP